MKEKFEPYTKALIFLLIFHTIANILWISINKVPPTWDAALHTIITNKMYVYLQQGLSNFNLLEFIKISDYYPPVIHSFGVVLAWLGGGNYKLISLTGTLFFIVMLFFQFLYTEKLFKNKFVAFFASFFLSFFITMYQQSRDHMLDIPMTAFLLGGLYFFEKSKLLSQRKETILFFVFLALAFLSKWYALVYFSVPVLFSLLQIFKKMDAKKIQNIILGSLLVLVLCAPWYFVNWKTLVSIASFTATGELADPQVLLSKENIIFYLKVLIMFQTTFIGFLVFTASLIAALKDVKKKQVALILVTIFFNYLFFSFVSNKNIRYIIPLMPFVAMMMAYGFSELFKINKQLGKVATLVFSGYLVFTYLMLSFAVPVLPKYKYAINLPILGWVDVIYLHTYPVRVLFDRNRTYAPDIMTTISKTRTNQEPSKLFNLVDRDFLNSYSLDPVFYTGSNLNLKNTELVWLGHLKNYNTEAEMAHFLEIEQVEYILVPQKHIGVIEAIREYEHIERFQKFVLGGSLHNFKIIAEYKLPGDDYFKPDTVYLYTKTGP